jgi:hypothetical protein
MVGPGGVPGGPGYGVGRAITPSNTDLDYLVQQATQAQGKATTAGALAPGAKINGVLFTGATNITITSGTTHTLTLGTGLSGGSFNGSVAVTATVTGAPWSGVTGTPTSLAGYGITDAYTKTASDARFAAIAGPFPWADVSGTPTSLAGYGITSPLNIAQGGTALSAYTVGDVLYASGTTALSKLGIGAANTVLTSSGSAPQWGPLACVSVSKTIIVAPSGGDFTTLAAALASLASTVIADGTEVTIQVNDGTYTSTSPILMDQVFGNNIQIVGQNTYAVNVTSIQSSSGSAGAWALVLNVSTVANVAVNDYIVLSAPSGGTLPSYLAGCFKITNVDAVNTRITIASTHQNATAPSGSVAATGVVCKTIFAFTGCDGFRIWNGGALYMDKIVVVGDGTASTNGISLQDVGRVFVTTVVGVVGFGATNIFVNYNAELNSTGLLVASGAGADGFVVDSGGVLDVSAAIASGNGLDGVNAVAGFWRAQSSIATGNAAAGFLSQKGGQVVLKNPAATGNTTWGFLTASQGLISRTGATASNNGSGSFADGFVTTGIGINGTAVSQTGIVLSGTTTAAGGAARGIFVEPTLAAAANNDELWGLQIGSAYTPGVLTGLDVRGLVLASFSVAAFTSPADPKMMTIGVLTGTGATNAYGIQIGNVTGATNNYLIASSTVATFNITAAGALTLASTGTFGGLLTASNGLTVATGKTVTITGTTITGAPTWGSGQTFPTVTSTGVATFNADAKIATVGFGLYVKEGTNATMGTATLVAGTVTVATSKVTANSRIFISRQNDPATLGVLPCDVTGRTAGTSFTITSSSVLDTASVAWILIEPA